LKFGTHNGFFLGGERACAGWSGTFKQLWPFIAPSRKSCRLPPVCVLARWTLLPARAACASKIAVPFDCALQQSQPVWRCLRDEPFTIRDVQFDNPQVWIALTSSLQVFREFM
jgi:hypothetical protein